VKQQSAQRAAFSLPPNTDPNDRPRPQPKPRNRPATRLFWHLADVREVPPMSVSTDKAEIIEEGRDFRL